MRRRKSITKDFRYPCFVRLSSLKFISIAKQLRENLTLTPDKLPLNPHYLENFINLSKFMINGSKVKQANATTTKNSLSKIMSSPRKFNKIQ